MRLSLCLLLLLLLGCAPGQGLPPIPSGPGDYRLGAGDTVRLIVFGEDQLSGEYRVSDAGNIAVPLLGGVHTAGLTPAGLERAIASALVRDKLLREPSVVTEVTTYRPIFVLGEVNKPGEYPYRPGMTMVTAAAVAGGFTYRAMQSYASVVRTLDGHAVEGKATRQTFIQPGDVITIYERWF